MANDEEKKQIIITGIREVDEKLGGGIPVGSLVLVEGHSDAGKSVLCQHLAYGTLCDNEVSVAYYTTENTVKSLITQMDSLSLFTVDYFLSEKFRIYPLSMGSDIKDAAKPFQGLLEHFSNLPKNFKMAIVDSTTMLLAHSSVVPIIDFFSACKELCDHGSSIILVTHSYAFDEEILIRTRSLCDAHIRLKLEVVGDRLVKVMEVLKVRGADRGTGDIVSFEVEPKSGMRIIPFSRAKV